MQTNNLSGNLKKIHSFEKNTYTVLKKNEVLGKVGIINFKLSQFQIEYVHLTFVYTDFINI